MSPVVQAVLDRLEDARQRWWVFSLLCSVAAMIWASLALLVVFILLDVMLIFSPVFLTVLFVAWCVFTAALLAGTFLRLFRRQRSIEAAARRVELSLPDVGSDLINLIQLSQGASDDSEGFRQAAIAEAASRVQHIRFQSAAEKHTRWNRWRLGLQTPRDLVECCAALVLLVGATLAFQFLIPTWASATDRLFQPWAALPQIGGIQILEVKPGDADVLTGSRLEITARIADPGSRIPKATLYFTPEGERAEASRAMIASEGNRSFAFSFPAVTSPMRYRLQIADSQSGTYRIGVRELPTIQDVEVTYEYPSYLGMSQHSTSQKHADLEGPQYTLAHLKLICSTKLSRGHVQLKEMKELKEQQISGTLGEDGRTLRLDIPLVASTTYTIHLYNDLGQTDSQPRVNSIRVAVDAPPAVQIAQPPRDSTSAPGEELAMVVRATDDHGLGGLRLEWRQDAEENQGEDVNAAGEVLHDWGTLTGTTTTQSHKVVLTPERFAAGKSVSFRALAIDRRQVTFRGVRRDPQTTTGPWHRVRLVAAEQKAEEAMERLEGVGAKLRAILQLQVRARVVTAELNKTEDFASVSRQVSDVRQRQVQIHSQTTELIQSLRPNQDAAIADLRQSLNKLANGDMVEAVQQAEAAMRMKHAGQLPMHIPPLKETQDRIITVLRALLDLTRQATAEALSELKERPASDLPDDAQEKLKALSDKLRDFLRQQKRVIDATENLAKKPVEDFTEEEKQLLEKLAAAEDEWSRFMQETHTDLSKLPEQDFANPSTLQELVEVQTELKMAADALTKKTADIAVPLEQLGAEMAEELVTNIEKWLPDTPDRERWSQEEPLTDAMKEAPMAELPQELEDLVGELMENEEDLFDEMEDVSSSWADSIDKGAGWDAMDGPISNMSAKGVTGNRLPNTNEIGGRSGEGRQGQASGEMVSDTAVGKGGRKTPSRLTPDPFVKGQVKDFSKDPVGGATGGGKESGVGGEGLEGPVPPQRQRELDRMANRQADLRNRAESVDLKFQILNYQHTDLKKMIDMMKAVEIDLRNGRYQSALRRRDVVLEGLGNVKTYLDGEFQIRKDSSSSLPNEMQKELLGSMLEDSPAGWDELNRKYFARLTGEQAPAQPVTSEASKKKNGTSAPPSADKGAKP